MKWNKLFFDVDALKNKIKCQSIALIGIIEPVAEELAKEKVNNKNRKILLTQLSDKFQPLNVTQQNMQFYKRLISITHHSSNKNEILFLINRLFSWFPLTTVLTEIYLCKIYYWFYFLYYFVWILLSTEIFWALKLFWLETVNLFCIRNIKNGFRYVNPIEM